MVVKIFLATYLLYDFLLRYGVEVFLDEVSSVWSILACCRIGGIQSEVVCSYMCLCIDVLCEEKSRRLYSYRISLFLRLGESKIPLMGFTRSECLGMKKKHLDMKLTN